MDDNQIINYYEIEFNMLKDAHFQTSQKIISFFQFALLIFSAPIALLTSEQITKPVLGSVFIVIGVIEVLVIAYLSTLRTEALLYARQINRIRAVLYSKGILGKKIDDINNKKILFSQDKKPAYRDWNQFLFIVLVLGFFSAFYVAFGTYKLFTGLFGFSNVKCIFVLAIVLGLLMVIISCLAYVYTTTYGEKGTAYYKQNIGVDIDGVLNKHEEKFIEILKKQTDITIEKITHLPVHISGKITREQEHNVFETKEYWEGQQLSNGAKEYLIEDIKNTLGFNVYIFTWRNWDVRKSLDGKPIRFSIKKHTKKWLKEKGISYKKIKFEKGNYNKPISLFDAQYKTRYYYSKKYKIRYFVEDDLRNAERLSHICEYVFLINHTYNENPNLPYNVIRVDSWKEIAEIIKRL